jgi:hypothetical protein
MQGKSEKGNLRGVIQMMAVLKWFALLPFQFGSTFAAWIVAPICPLFAHDYSLKGTWLWWATTPNTDLRGDPDHQAKYHYKNSYLQQVHWVLRNPAVNFQRDWIGYSVQIDDEYDPFYKPLARGGEFKFERITALNKGRVVCWMFYLVWVYPFKTDKALRLLFGWKTWDIGVKDPLQYTARITLWKSVN